MSKAKKSRWDAFTTAELRQLCTGDIGPALAEEMAGAWETRIETKAGASPPSLEEVRAASTAAAVTRPANDALDDLWRAIIKKTRLRELLDWLVRRATR